MASFSAAFSVGPKTLTGTTVDAITLTSLGRYVDIHNISGTSPLYVTLGVSAPADPVAGANDVLVVPAGRTRTINMWYPPTAVIIKVLGSGNEYLVERLS